MPLSGGLRNGLCKDMQRPGICVGDRYPVLVAGLTTASLITGPIFTSLNPPPSG